MTRFEKWLLYGATLVTALSGVTFFVMKRFLEPSDPWAFVNHPLEPWALKLHILAAPLMVFGIGLITTRHIVRSLKSSLPTGRQSGLIATFSFVPLVITGYLIQTVTSPLATTVLGWTHLALGLSCAGALEAHRRVLHGRLLRKRPGALPVMNARTRVGSHGTTI